MWRPIGIDRQFEALEIWEQSNVMKVTTKEQVWQSVVASIVEMLRDQGEEPDEIRPSQSLVADLGIASVNIIHLMVTLEDRVDHPLNFRQLAIRDGDTLASDVTVGELYEFVCKSLALEGVERDLSAASRA